MSIGDVYRSVASYSHPFAASHNSKTVFYYRVATLTGSIDAENVGDEIITNFLTPMFTNVVGAPWGCVGLFTQNLDDPEDFSDTNPELNGQSQTNMLPGFVCWEVRSPWNGSGSRRSYKRLPCAGGSVLANNGNWTDNYLDDLRETALPLGDVFTLAGGTVEPVQMRHVKDPETELWSYEFNYVLTGTWQVNNSPQSQDSRKADGQWLDAQEPA